MGSTEKSARYKWREGKEEELKLFVDSRVKDGASVTQALKEYGKRHDMSWLTARWKYYQIRKRPEAARLADLGQGTAPEARSVAEGAREDDFLGYLAEFVTSARDVDQDIVQFVRGLSRLAALSRETTALRKEREQAVLSLRQDAELIGRVCRIIREWLDLPQVDRVGALKSFSERLSEEVARLESIRDRLAGA